MNKSKLVGEAQKLGYSVFEGGALLTIGEYTIDESSSSINIYEHKSKVYSTYDPSSAYTYVYGKITAPE